MEALGKAGSPVRDVYLLEAETLAHPTAFPAGRFVCFLACDARGLEVEEVSALVEKLLEEGVVYFAAWGPDCERVHDVFDEVVLDWPTPTANDVIMTTWHDGWSLEDAARFALHLAQPTAGFVAGCDSVLFLVVGSATWAQDIRRRFDEFRS